jgi:F-type H+-transporting ATPase subunit b
MASASHPSGPGTAPRWIRFAVAVPVLLLVLPEPAAAAVGGGEETIWTHIAKLTNFALLVGTLVYFLKGPLMRALAASGVQVRQDLVTASEMRAAAAAQLADIQQKMQTLPGELEALRRQGAADVQAEQARIKEAAALERERLLEQMRREIDMRTRIARRELTAHAAALAVGIAEERIRRTITADDHLRLVDRYTAQLGEAR